MKKPLRLKHPKTFNEKLQWLKLYDRTPIYTKLVDKYEVKNCIAGRHTDLHIASTLASWDRPKDVSFTELPARFVLKTTHGGGNTGVVVVKDKNTADIAKIRAALSKSMNEDLYTLQKEWPYKDVKKRIIAEEYLEDSDGTLTDYKFFCFNGFVHSVMLCLDRSRGDTKFYFFDKEWKLLRLNIRGKNAPADFTLPKPANMDRMFEIAKGLSMGMPFVRVDLYNVKGKIYFGEMTFYPDSGFDANLLPETDNLLGELINIDIYENHRPCKES